MRYFLLVTFLLFTFILSAQNFQVGDKVDMHSTDGNYYAASVIETSGTRYKIHFDAYAATSDTWVEGVNLVRGARVGDRVIVVAQQGTYYGTITEVLNTNYKVKYDGFNETYTLTRSQFNFISPATQQPVKYTTTTQQPATQGGFAIGNRVQALQGTTWYVAFIKEFKDGKYLVKYDGYNEEEWVDASRVRTMPSLSADKLKPTGGKTYLRSIRWIATGSTEMNWFFLGDNGVIVMDPKYGTNPINIAKEQQDNFRNVGTYTIGKDQLIVKWLNGKTTNYLLKYSGGEIIELDAGGIMVRQKGLPDGYRLSGTYTGSIAVGNLASAGNYTFTKDGKVSRTITGIVRTEDASAVANNVKSGTYAIKGNTLFMSYPDGTRETANIGVFSGNKIALNGTWMTGQ